MSEAGHTEGRKAFTAHCHPAACPLPGSPDRRSLGTKVSGWGLAPARGWRVLSCCPPVVPALLLSLVVILGFYEPLDTLIFPVSASMSGFCHWQARAPVGHSSLPGLLEALLAGGGHPGQRTQGFGVSQHYALRGWGRPRSGVVLQVFLPLVLLACLVPSGHCRLRSHGRWGDSVYRTELRRHRPPQSEGRSQGPPREARAVHRLRSLHRPSGKMPHRVSIALTVLPGGPRPPLSRGGPKAGPLQEGRLCSLPGAGGKGLCSGGSQGKAQLANGHVMPLKKEGILVFPLCSSKLNK